MRCWSVGMILLILTVNGLLDLKTRRIFPGFTLLLLLAGIIARKGVDLTALFPGLLFLLTAVLTKERVGAGDGIVLLACGAWSDLITVCRVLIPAIIGALLTGVVVKTARPAGKVTLPFVPFLWLSYMILLVSGVFSGSVWFGRQ